MNYKIWVEVASRLNNRCQERFYMRVSLFAKFSLTVSLVSILVFLSGCGQAQILSSTTAPKINRSKRVAVYALDNYTDTPRAGMRAANIAEGVLLAKGYRVDHRVNDTTRVMTQDQKIADARGHQNHYLFVGGVSEWRYKTGIDGEPAISLQMKLIDVQTKQVIWSAMGSDSSWGNDSIGTVAQGLISSMIPGNTK